MEMVPRYYIWTIGCQMNKSESERLGSYLEAQGYDIALSPADADLILLNSCAVRQSAERRVANKLAALKPLKRTRPGTVLALTGCMVGADTAVLRESYPYVDYFLKPGGFPEWLGGSAAADLPLPAHPPVSAFVPIMQGCNNFCAYCIVPYRRGREHSRPADTILCEAQGLVRRGAKEIVLLGQNVDSYGHDLPGKPDLADLLGELNVIAGLARIRFLTNHPKDMSPRLIEAIASLDKVCEEVTLPVQSGSDEVLRVMRRGYTAAQYRDLAARLRQGVPGVALSTDVIVGFPGETYEHFQETFNLLQDIRFDMVHVAAYSPRPGTIAARELADNVPPEEKRRRLALIEGLQEKVLAEINSALKGKTVEVLVEDKQKSKWRGRTRTGKLVFFSDDGEHRGRLVPVKIERTSPWSLQGTCYIKEEK